MRSGSGGGSPSSPTPANARRRLPAAAGPQGGGPARRLDILVFNVQWVEGETFSTHLETLEYLKTHSFKVIPHYSCDQVEEAVARIARSGRSGTAFPSISMERS